LEEAKLLDQLAEWREKKDKALEAFDDTEWVMLI
jgi:hypothetical protein